MALPIFLRCTDIQQNRLIGMQHFLLEIIFVDIEGRYTQAFL